MTDAGAARVSWRQRQKNKAHKKRRNQVVIKSHIERIASLAPIIAIIGCATTAPFPSLDNAYAPSGAPDIDLAEYALTFDEEFDTIDISGRRCDTRWIAHTPWSGDFGAATFANPSRGFPFVTSDGMLRIEARKDPDGRWFAGLLSSYNPCGEGFAQQYGYFEMRARLPKGDGFWPAFWLIGIDRNRFTAEIDVLENHTVRPDKLVSSVRVHPRTEGIEGYNVHSTYITPPGALGYGFNTFGVSVEEAETVVYFNRREVWRTPTPEEFHQPLFLLLNLAMEAGEITESTPEQAFMYVDYVKVFARH